ncbi:MAG: DNA adenine methylase [Phycisphaerae bacterium]|nr:DNA adenine methylase [Phycisphaerae bacterium]
MKISALAPWFGGKRNIAPAIIKLLGKHRVYWEPFCGSMAVLLNKEPCVMETVNDLHGDLINLARVVQKENTALELYGRLARTLMHEQLHIEAANRYRARGYFSNSDEPDIDRAYDYFLCAWMGRNGVTGTLSYNQGFCVRYIANGGHAAKRWRSVIESIPAWHYRLANVTILNRDAFEIIRKIQDTDGTVIYIDPPYLVKGAKYIHDFKPDEHTKLAEILQRFKKSRVVVSYYDHPLLTELYPGWTQHKIDVSKAMSNAGSQGKKDVRAVEVLLVNSKKDLFNSENFALIESA